MDHYEKLGVKPNATQDEIKRAYRAKATQTHPDKGGTAEEFAPIATAYEVLSDPERRLLYDSTGQDRRTPIEKEVQQALLNFFNEALSQARDIEVLAFVRRKVEDGKQTLVEQRRTLKGRQEKLKAKRGKIKSTAAVNVAHLVIDGELKKVENVLSEIDHQEQLGDAILLELKTYSEKWNPPQMMYSDSFTIQFK